MPPPVDAAAPFGIEYRPANDQDLPFLALLYSSTRAEELAVTGWPDRVKQQFLAQQFEEQHRHYRGHYPAAEWLVIERANERIGRLYIEERPDEFRIIDIALLTDVRGGGVGGAILSDIIAAAEAEGKAVTIHVESRNRAADLYRRLGFVRIEEGGVYDLMAWRPGSRAAN